MKDEGLAMALEQITPWASDGGNEWHAIQFWAVVRRDPEDEGSVQVASMRSKMVKLEQGNTPCTMKKTIYMAAAIIVAVVISVAFFATTKVSSQQVEIVEAVAPMDPLTHRQRAWLGALEWCESRANPEAINPNDRDGTPSYGILQFKPSTFTYYQLRYGVAGAQTYMDPGAQEAIVEQMIINNDVKWSQQFPECVRKLGNPPQLSTQSIDKK